MTNEDFIGWTWHLHHNIQLEWCSSYQQRCQYIQENEPERERERQLRLFTPVKNPERLPPLVQTWQVYDKAWRVSHQQEIEALHKEEHPDCPWNGYTIFPEYYVTVWP